MSLGEIGAIGCVLLSFIIIGVLQCRWLFLAITNIVKGSGRKMSAQEVAAIINSNGWLSDIAEAGIDAEEVYRQKVLEHLTMAKREIIFVTCVAAILRWDKKIADILERRVTRDCLRVTLIISDEQGFIDMANSEQNKFLLDLVEKGVLKLRFLTDESCADLHLIDNGAFTYFKIPVFSDFFLATNGGDDVLGEHISWVRRKVDELFKKSVPKDGLFV